MRKDLKQYQVDDNGFWDNVYMRGIGGYNRAELANAAGWREIASWGEQGWYVGDGPLCMCFFREREGRFEVAENVEGDITIYSCPTEALRNEVMDCIAFFRWSIQERPWVVGFSESTLFSEEARHLRGPYPRPNLTVAR
jgi:hypothetical protein